MQSLLVKSECAPAELLWHPFVDDGSSCSDKALCMALLNLPIDVLRLIASHLPTRDVLAIRTTCKQLKELASSQVKVLDISLKAVKSDRLMQLITCLSTSFTSLRTLVLSNIARGGYRSLSDIAHATVPLTSIHRLVLLDIPVYELRPMRKLQMIQMWETFKQGQNGGGRSWREVELNFMEQGVEEGKGLPWEGCNWFFHSLSKLTRLESLEIKLAPALTTRKRFLYQTMPDEGEEEEEGEEVEEVNERLILGQATLIGSLASLGSLMSLSHLSMRLLDGFDLSAVRTVHASYGLGEEAPSNEDDWVEDEERSEEESDSDHLPDDDEMEALHYHEGVEIEHDPGEEPVNTQLPSFLLTLSAAMAHLPLSSISIQNSVLPPKSLIALISSLPSLESLSVKNSLVCISHKIVKAIARLSMLESLELSSVRLVFSKGDADDCPERIMTSLYGVLGALPSFSSLKFELDMRDNMHYMHSAYLIGLCEDGAIEENLRAAGRIDEDEDQDQSPPLSITPGFRQSIRDLSLSPVILDSDYTLMILGSLVNLSSLNLTYETWPLSLSRDDLSLLAPLSSLTSLKLNNFVDQSSDDFLLALTSKSLNAILRSMQNLKTFHYSGPIVLERNASLAFDLSSHTSITDLSLKQVLPFLLRLPRFPHCLPKSLVNLSLSLVALSPTDLAGLGQLLPDLQTLTLEEFQFGYESLLSLASDESLRQRLTLLAVSSTLSSSSSPPSRSCPLPFHQGEQMEPELSSLSRLSCKMLGQFKNLHLLLLALPPAPSASNADNLLRLLQPSLMKLKGLTLQAPRSKNGRAVWSDDVLEMVIRKCLPLRSLHISDGSKDTTVSLRASLPYL